MARRRKQGTAEDVMDLTAMAPWWVGVVLAVVSYVGLHALAQQPMQATVPSGQVGSAAAGAMWRALASVGQYFVPLIFLAGAAMSAFRRQQAEQLHASTAHRGDAMAHMTWHEFEVLVGEFFRRQGFSAVNNYEAGPDGGVDVLLKKGADTYLVQCKHWRALRVGVQPVRELYGVMAAQRVAGAYVVTSGEFTDEARRFSEGRELKLIDGKALQREIRAQAATPTVSKARPEARPMAAAPSLAARTYAPAPEPQDRVAPTMGAAPAQSVPLCPLCSAPMVQRQARSGANAGNRFWGCSRYGETKCRGTRALA